jgi:hypothetical protein
VEKKANFLNLKKEVKMGWNDHLDISSCDSCGDYTPLDELNEDSFCMECVERHADEHEAKRLLEGDNNGLQGNDKPNTD